MRVVSSLRFISNGTMIAVAMLLALPNAFAQELEEVVTTAQRRATDVQDTPIAVTSLDELQLDRRVVTETQDLGRQVPNLIAYNNVTLGASNAYWLRGIGSTESLATFDPPVITYTDEIVDPRQNGNNINLVEVERLEVLRGPQGTLFGRNTTGGAINIITKKPTIEEFDASGELRVGEFSEVMVKGMVNIPVGDRMAAKISAYNLQDDGWQTSVVTGEEYNSVDGWGARAAFRFLITDAVTWDISSEVFEQDHQNLQSIIDPALSPTDNSADDGPVWALSSPELNDVYFRNCKNGSDAETWGRNGCTANETAGVNVYSNLAIDLDSSKTLNIIAGYRELDHNFLSPLFASQRGGFELPLANNGDHDMFQIEAKLTGETSDGRVNYVTGLFYLSEENHSVFETSLSNNTGAYIPLDRNVMQNDNENLAWYGQLDYQLNGQWTLTGGLRWTDEEKSIPFFANTVKGFDHTDIAAEGIILSDTVNNVTGRIVAQYEPNDTMMFFGSVTTGFKSGGWNGRAGAANLMTHFNEEEAISFELGTRLQFADNRARLNATLFDVTYDDLQLPSLAFEPTPGQPPVFVNNNAGELGVTGLELDFTYAVTDGLTVYITLGLQDAAYNSTTPGAEVAGIFASNKPQRAPDSTYLIGLEYARDVAEMDGEIYFNADFQSTDQYWANAQNDPVTNNPGFDSVNAAVGYLHSSGRWGVQLDCQNCTDERYWTTDFLSARFISDPMRWGLSFRFNYL